MHYSDYDNKMMQIQQTKAMDLRIKINPLELTSYKVTTQQTINTTRDSHQVFVVTNDQYKHFPSI